MSTHLKNIFFLFFKAQLGYGEHIHVHGGIPHEDVLRRAQEEGQFKREYIARHITPEEDDD